jgi:hypothetical protein
VKDAIYLPQLLDLYSQQRKKSSSLYLNEKDREKLTPLAMKVEMHAKIDLGSTTYNKIRTTPLLKYCSSKQWTYIV